MHLTGTALSGIFVSHRASKFRTITLFGAISTQIDFSMDFEGMKPFLSKRGHFGVFVEGVSGLPTNHLCVRACVYVS